MTEQPEALRLADVIANDPCSKAHHDEAADELRRLSEIETLYLAAMRGRHAMSEELLALTAQRDALLEALKEIDSWLVCSCIATAEDMAQSFPHMQQVASAAIKAVEDGS